MGTIQTAGPPGCLRGGFIPHTIITGCGTAVRGASEIREGKMAERCCHPGCTKEAMIDGLDGIPSAKLCGVHQQQLAETSYHDSSTTRSTNRVRHTRYPGGPTINPSAGWSAWSELNFDSQDTHGGTESVAAASPPKRRQTCRHLGCAKYPSFGVLGTTEAEYCSQHAQEGMVNVRRKTCGHLGCTKTPSFGVHGTRKAEFCPQHAHEGMVDVVAEKECIHAACGAKPTCGVKGGKAEYCMAHAKEGMFPVLRGNKSSYCCHTACSRRASYGAEGTREAKYCGTHASEGMVDVFKKKCAHLGCSTRPAYGLEGTRPVYCAKHAPAGTVDVITKRCAHASCRTRPTYGLEGTKKSVFCAKHAHPGMVDICSQRCRHQGCATRPHYGVEGSKKPEYCGKHAQVGMVDIVNKKCGHPTCTKAASFGSSEAKKIEFCTEHAKAGMVNLSCRRCAHPDCNKHPSYGVEGAKRATHCSPHAEEGMVDVVSKRCDHPNCSSLATHGAEDRRIKECCRHHATTGMVFYRTWAPPSRKLGRRRSCEVRGTMGLGGGFGDAESTSDAAGGTGARARSSKRVRLVTDADDADPVCSGLVKQEATDQAGVDAEGGEEGKDRQEERGAPGQGAFHVAERAAGTEEATGDEIGSIA